jgi:hypothetical protein
MKKTPEFINAPPKATNSRVIPAKAGFLCTNEAFYLLAVFCFC